MLPKLYIYILIMALVTYLIRMIPMAFISKDITSPFIKSFLYYMPYACLATMSFPAILHVTGNVLSGVAGLITALYLAYKEKSLLSVAFSAFVAVFVVERVISFLS